MPRKPVKVEVVDEPAGRFIVTTYADGEVQRDKVVELPRKKRFPPRPYWHWHLDRSRKRDL
jgi:hypothetical protein